MDLYMPSKEEWEAMQNSISVMAENILQFKSILEKNGQPSEYFPEYMTLDIAAKYLRCGLGRVKSMVYKQKILPTHHIDLTTTIYVSRKEIDELKYRAKIFRERNEKEVKGKK